MYSRIPLTLVEKGTHSIETFYATDVRKEANVHGQHSIVFGKVVPF